MTSAVLNTCLCAVGGQAGAVLLSADLFIAQVYLYSAILTYVMIDYMASALLSTSLYARTSNSGYLFSA